jgi:DNA-binding SARP family transcriptional activator/tetratricopeptide (TPR) repeat protein
VVDFRILGPVEVLSGGRRVAIERQARVLLAMLLVSRNQTVSLDALIDGLWPQGAPLRAKNSLHVQVSRLRRALAAADPLTGSERITLKQPGYELRTLDGEVDADRFERMLTVAEAALQERRFASASSTLREALTLVRGPVLGECRDAAFAQAEVARLEDMKVTAVERRVDADLALGRHALLTGELEGVVADHPLYERFREQLMLALYRTGRQADALAAYQDAYQILGEELGVEPGHGLREMQRAILRQDPAIDFTPPEPEAGPAARGRLPFVGRKGARQVLEEAWHRARSGERQLVVVEGESGTGKTRLAAEVAAAASSDGGEILLGRTVGDAPLPFFPFVEALSQHAARLDPDRLQSIAGPGAHYLAQLLPGLPSPERPGRPGEAEAQASSHRYLMFEAVVALLTAIAAPAGAVLILDDLHQADPSTIRLLEHVARHQSRARLLIIAAVTIPSPPSPVTGVLLDLTAGGLADQITLDGLSGEEVGELLVAVTGRNGGIPMGLTQAVTDLTAGIPLFVIEMGKGLPELDTHQAQALAADLPIPERIQAILERRLSRVAPFVTSLLVTASVIGTTFDARVLAALRRQPESAVADQLEAAMAAGLVHEDPTAGQYRFTHQLVRRALLERVGGPTRARLQSEIASFLIGPHAPVGTSLALIAHHFTQAARFNARQAVIYTVRAGDDALSRLAFENAVDFYRSALASLCSFGDPDPRLESRILVDLGRAHQAAYQRSEAMVAFRRAGELAVSQADDETLADAAWGLMVSAEFSTTDGESVELFRRALAAFDTADGSLRARLTAGLAKVLPAGDPEAASLARTAVDIARRVNQPATLAWVLSAAVLVTWTPGNLKWRQAATDEVIALADELGWVELAMDARNLRSAMLEELAEFERADADRAIVERWATESRRPFFTGLAAMRRTERALLEGRYRDAENEAGQMLAAGSESPDFFAAYGVQLLLLRQDQGRLAEIDTLVAGKLAEAPHIPGWQVAQAVVDNELGRRSEARRRLTALAAGRVAGLPRDWLWLATTMALADVCADLGALDVAEELHAALSPFTGKVAVLAHGIAATGAVDGPLGRLETLQRKWDAAEQHLADAIALNRRIGAVPALARAQLGYAELLLRRGGPGYCGQAARLIDEASATVGYLGMAGLEPALQQARAMVKAPQENRKRAPRS